MYVCKNIYIYVCIPVYMYTCMLWIEQHCKVYESFPIAAHAAMPSSFHQGLSSTCCVTASNRMLRALSADLRQVGYIACAIATSAWDAGCGSPFVLSTSSVTIRWDFVGLQLGEKLWEDFGVIQGSYQCELYSQYTCIHVYV